MTGKGKGKMGRRTKLEMELARYEDRREARGARLLGLADLLTDKLETALVAMDVPDVRDLKQASAILKELAALTDVCTPEERRERALQLARLEREVTQYEEDDDRQLMVSFENADQAWEV